MGAEMADTEVPVSEVAPRPDLGRQYVGRTDRKWQAQWHSGGYVTYTEVTDDEVDDAHIDLNNTDNDGKDPATEAESGAEMAGSESKADVAPKDGSASIVADCGGAEADECARAIRLLRDESRLKTGVGDGQQFWADVDRSSSNRL